MANSVDPDQIAPIGAVCSGSMLFASMLISSVVLGNYLQQTTSADDIFRCISILCALRVNVFFLRWKATKYKLSIFLLYAKNAWILTPKLYYSLVSRRTVGRRSVDNRVFVGLLIKYFEVV